MNYKDINTAISKAFYNEDKIVLGMYDENTVGITLDGIVLWLIPEKEFIFDKTKLTRNGAFIDINVLIPTANLEDAVITPEITLTDNKTQLYKLKSKNIEAYANMKLFKTFDKNATFKIKSPISPILVYENNILAGIIMPIRKPKNN